MSDDIKRQIDIAWLAGIIEGEGYIGVYPKTSIHVAMTDEDVVRRVYEVAGSGTFAGPFKPSSKHRKLFWRWHVHYRDDVKKILTDILPHMGIRRTASVKGALERINNMRTRARTHGDIRHGTAAGYAMERLRGIEHCNACLRAVADNQLAYRRKKKAIGELF